MRLGLFHHQRICLGGIAKLGGRRLGVGQFLDLGLQRRLVGGQGGHLRFETTDFAGRSVTRGNQGGDRGHCRIGVGHVDGQPVDQHGLHGLLRFGEGIENVGGEGIADGKPVLDRAFGTGAAPIYKGDMVAARDLLLARLADSSILRGEGAVGQRRPITVGQFALASIYFGDRGGVRQQKVEREIIAVPQCTHDGAARMVAPICSRHRLVGVVIRYRLADKRARGRLIKYRSFVAQDIDNCLITQPMRVVRVNFAARILVNTRPTGARANGKIAVRCAARCIKREGVRKENHGPQDRRGKRVGL